jgi:DNA-binding Lrp family transcriptional regulator
MVTAFVLINTMPGTEEKVAEALRKKDVVSECHVVYGDYDMHIKIEIENLHALDEFIYGLRTLKGIEYTMTLVAVGER